MNKEIIKKNFSKHAKDYDKHSSIQDVCGIRLISKIEKEDFYKILDIGCGTGNYTRLLRERFPSAGIKAVDISREMVNIARDKLKDEAIGFITADAETADFEEEFDLVSSNASFQWFEDLESALSRYKKLLRRNGMILFSLFGPRTFYELDHSLKMVLGEEISVASSGFAKRASIANILKRLFRDIKIEQKIYKERHDSLLELLKKIKYTGARGEGIDRDNFWTSKKISNVEKIYKRRFKHIVATYQVFFCRGIK